MFNFLTILAPDPPGPHSPRSDCASCRSNFNFNPRRDRPSRPQAAEQSYQTNYGSFQGYRKKPPPSRVGKFSGKKEEFLKFQTSFRDAYEETGLSKISLAIRLGEHLEGDAAKRFGYLCSQPDETSYDTLMKMLETFYGSAKTQANEKLQKFNSMPTIRQFNSNTISLLCSVLEEHWHLLKKALGDSFTSKDNHLFFAFSRKLPIHELAKYRDYVRSSGSLENFSSFKAWIYDQWETYQYARDNTPADRVFYNWCSNSSDQPDYDQTELQSEGSVRSHSSGRDLESGPILMRKDGYKNPPKKPFTPSKPKQKQECLYCKKTDHSIWKCEDFTSLGQNIRYKFVRDERLCLRCLCLGHMAKDCLVRFVCDVKDCGRRHHRLLHPDKPSKLQIKLFMEQGFESDLESDSDSDSEKE